MQAHKEKMEAALTMDVLATDLAEYLVRKGVRIYFGLCMDIASEADFRAQMPFRETHHISGRAVALAESRKCQLNELTLEDFRKLHDLFTDDIHEVFNFEASVERRNAIGGPSKEMIARQIGYLRSSLSS